MKGHRDRKKTKQADPLTMNTPFLAGLKCRVVGLGRTKENPIQRPVFLQELDVKIFDRNVCKTKIKGVTDAHICAGVPKKQFKAFCKVKAWGFFQKTYSMFLEQSQTYSKINS